MEQGGSLVQCDWCSNKRRETSCEDRGTQGGWRVAVAAEMEMLQPR